MNMSSMSNVVTLVLIPTVVGFRIYISAASRPAIRHMCRMFAGAPVDVDTWLVQHFPSHAEADAETLDAWLAAGALAEHAEVGLAYREFFNLVNAFRVHFEVDYTERTGAFYVVDEVVQAMLSTLEEAVGVGIVPVPDHLATNAFEFEIHYQKGLTIPLANGFGRVPYVEAMRQRYVDVAARLRMSMRMIVDALKRAYGGLEIVCGKRKRDGPRCWVFRGCV